MRPLGFVLLLLTSLGALRAQEPTTPRATRTGERKLAVPGGQIWYRAVGAGRGTPLILLHGGPGNPSVYLKSLEALGDERVVVRYDQLGAGYSDVVHDTSLFNIRHFVEELELLRRHLALERVALYGHSWGATLALEYYRAYPQHVASLILAGETLSIPEFTANVRRLIQEMPDSMSRAVRRRLTGQPHDSTAYRAAMNEFRTHFTRTPVPAESDSLARLQNPEIGSLPPRPMFAAGSERPESAPRPPSRETRLNSPRAGQPRPWVRGSAAKCKKSDGRGDGLRLVEKPFCRTR